MPAAASAKSARSANTRSVVAPGGVVISHPERVIYPDIGLSKGELALYYAEIAERMLPHLVGRPLSVVRCPAGLDAGAVSKGVHQTFKGPRMTKCFFQKHTSEGTAGAIASVRAPEHDKTAEYLAVDDVRGLVSLVQFGTLEIHPWGARADLPDAPDRMFFDLDPGPGVTWARVVEAALAIRDLLKNLGLQSFVKTTGGKGLHVVVPLNRTNSWDEVKGFSLALAEKMSREQPDGYVANMSKRLRDGRIFVDYLRNTRGATAVAPFSSRARPGAPVSAPVKWSELGPDLGPAAFTVRNLRDRLRRLKRDPWHGFEDAQQGITPEMLAELERAPGHAKARSN